MTVVTLEEIAVLMELISGPNRPRLRVVVLSSPPWGVFKDELHDTALTTPEMAVGLSISCDALYLVFFPTAHAQTLPAYTYSTVPSPTLRNCRVSSTP
jgi:hypothetical protein